MVFNETLQRASQFIKSVTKMNDIFIFATSFKTLIALYSKYCDILYFDPYREVEGMAFS